MRTALFVQSIVSILSILSPVGSVAGDTIELSNGDRITGTIIETNDDGTVIESPVFGRVEIPHGHIMEVAAAPGEDAGAVQKAETATAAAQTARAAGADTSARARFIPPPKPEPAGLFGTGFLRGWTKSIAFGTSGATGNSENLSLYFNANATYEDDRDRWLFDAAYLLSTDSGTASENLFWAGLRKDWLLPDSKWFYFAQGRYDWDEFQTWKHRVSAHGGLGYEVITTENFDLRLRGGPGFSQEFSPDQFNPEALAGVDIDWKIDENQSFRLSSTIFPNLEDTGEFRTLTDVAWVAALQAADGLSLKIGAQHEYQSRVGAGVKESDLRYYAALQFDF